MIEKDHLHLLKYVFINPLSANPTKWVLQTGILLWIKIFEIIKIDAPAKTFYGCFFFKFSAWKKKATYFIDDIYFIETHYIKGIL